MRMSTRNGKNFIERKIHETYLFYRLSHIYVVSILSISLFSFKFATDCPPPSNLITILPPTCSQPSIKGRSINHGRFC